MSEQKTIVIVGTAESGKTAIANILSKRPKKLKDRKPLGSDYVPTIVRYFYEGEFKYKDKTDTAGTIQTQEFLILDTPNPEKISDYETQLPNYLSQGNVILLVIDHDERANALKDSNGNLIVDKENTLKYFFNAINLNQLPDAQVCVVLNKVDRVISY